jgi:hypothetical protein
MKNWAEKKVLFTRDLPGATFTAAFCLRFVNHLASTWVLTILMNNHYRFRDKASRLKISVNFLLT